MINVYEGSPPSPSPQPPLASWTPPTLSLVAQAPLLTDGPVGISQTYDGHLRGSADAVIQRIMEMPEVAYIEQDSTVRAFETQRFAPWVRSLTPTVTSRGRLFAAVGQPRCPCHLFPRTDLDEPHHPTSLTVASGRPEGFKC